MKRTLRAIRAAWAVFWWIALHPGVGWTMVEAPQERQPLVLPDEYYEEPPRS